MRIDEITAEAGGRPRRKRVGRGESSGHGRTSGRGNKGAQSRSGYKSKRLYEGGQKALYSRFPKRGFNNYNFRVEYVAVNLDDLETSFNAGDRVDAEGLLRLRLIQGNDPQVKILARGTLTKKLKITAHAASEAAKAAVEKAGGSIEIIPRRNSAALAKAKRRTIMGKKPPEGPSRLQKKAAART